MNKGPQTNTPENEESKEDMISKKIHSRHIAICTADRTTSKLTLKDIKQTFSQHSFLFLSVVPPF